MLGYKKNKIKSYTYEDRAAAQKLIPGDGPGFSAFSLVLLVDWDLPNGVWFLFINNMLPRLKGISFN